MNEGREGKREKMKDMNEGRERGHEQREGEGT